MVAALAQAIVNIDNGDYIIYYFVCSSVNTQCKYLTEKKLLKDLFALYLLSTGY